MVRGVIGVVLAAVLLMAWGFVFWMFTGLGDLIVKKLPDEAAVVEALKKQNPPAGNYVAPFPDEAALKGDSAAFEEMARKHREGPLVQVIYRPDGEDMMGPKTYALGFTHMLASAALLALLLWLAGPGLPTFVARWLFVVLAAVFAAVYVQLANPIWFHHPWQAPLMLAFFDTAGWVFAAVPLAALVKRPG